MKRAFKTAVCLGLAALAIMSCVSGAAAVASDEILSSRTVTVDPSAVTDDFLVLSGQIVLSGQTSDGPDFEAAAADIAECALNFEESIDVSKYNIDYDAAQMNVLVSYLKYEYPELINLSSKYGYGVRYSGEEKTVYFKPVYLFSADEKDKYFTPFNAELDKIVALAQQQPNDFSKALYVHDYIVSACEYATEAYDDPDSASPFIFNAYGCLVDNRCVCQGYSVAYKAVMKRLSIPVDYALSEEMNHVWNTVTLDGNTYHADLTYDDPVPDMQGYVGHSNFLCTDDEITAQEHYSWTTSSTISDTSYPNRFWDDIKSRICINGDEVIYAAYNSTRKSYLERRNLMTNEVSVISSGLNGVRWKSGDGAYYYVGSFSRLELVGDVLYYSLPDGVNAIALDGSDDQSVYRLPQTAAGMLYGFVQRDDKFYGELTTSPTYDGEVAEFTLLPFKRSAVPGDADGDGNLTILDAIMVQKSALQIISLSEKAASVADMNGDGVISIHDALLIQRAVLTM